MWDKRKGPLESKLVSASLKGTSETLTTVEGTLELYSGLWHCLIYLFLLSMALSLLLLQISLKEESIEFWESHSCWQHLVSSVVFQLYVQSSSTYILICLSGDLEAGPHKIVV